MASARVPASLASGGRELWRSIAAVHTLDAAQKVQLLEACRAKDRLDRLDEVLRGDTETWLRLAPVRGGDDGVVVVKVDAALKLANETANVAKQLLAALRLPDETGRKPQYRGPRGAQSPSLPGGKTSQGKVSSLERARAAKAGA